MTYLWTDWTVRNNFLLTHIFTFSFQLLLRVFCALLPLSCSSTAVRSHPQHPDSSFSTQESLERNIDELFQEGFMPDFDFSEFFKKLPPKTEEDDGGGGGRDENYQDFSRGRKDRFHEERRGNEHHEGQEEEGNPLGKGKKVKLQSTIFFWALSFSLGSFHDSKQK